MINIFKQLLGNSKVATIVVFHLSCPSHFTILHNFTQQTRFKLPKVHHTPQYFTFSYNQQDSSCPRSITLRNTSYSCITNKIQVTQDVTNIQTSKYNFNVQNGIQAGCDIIFWWTCTATLKRLADFYNNQSLQITNRPGHQYVGLSHVWICSSSLY